MSKLRETKNPLNRETRNDINHNWDIISKDFENIDNTLADNANKVNNLSEKVGVLESQTKKNTQDIENLRTDLDALDIEEIIVIGEVTKQQGLKAREQGNKAEQQGNLAQQQGVKAEQQGNLAETNANEAKKQSDHAKTQGDYARDKAIEAQRLTSELQEANKDLPKLKADVIEATNTATTQAKKTQEILDKAQPTIDKIDTALPKLEGFEHKGVWNETTTYQLNNEVLHEGSTYRAKKETKGNLPTNETFWTIIATRGADGKDGKDGKDGVDGKGSVQSVNGILPDSKGNIQIENGGGGGNGEVATKNRLGVVKVGQGLAISKDGTLTLGAPQLNETFGGKNLIAGNAQAGFMGEIDASLMPSVKDIVDSLDFKAHIISKGVLRWFKVMFEGEIYYVGSQPIMYWAEPVWRIDQFDGRWKVKNPSGREFAIHMVTGFDSNVIGSKAGTVPTEESLNHIGASQYNQIVLPLSKKARTGEWKYPDAALGAVSRDWGVNLEDIDMTYGDEVTFGKISERIYSYRGSGGCPSKAGFFAGASELYYRPFLKEVKK